jgi:hypothetical protein
MAKQKNTPELDDDLFSEGPSKNPAMLDAGETVLPAKITAPAPNQNNLNAIQKHIESGGNVVMVPKDSKAIILRQSFNPAIHNMVEELTLDLKKITGINSQEDAANANAILKRAKQLDKAMDEDRKLMTSVLDQEKKLVMNYKDGIVGELPQLIEQRNKWITDFQAAEFKKQQEIERQLQAKRDEELRLAQAENDRKAKIEKLILDFENNVLRAISAATISDIDDKIKKLAGVKINKDTYMEFLPKAEIMYASCVAKMNSRKVELMTLAQAEKTNKEAAEKLKKEQEEKNRLSLEEQQRKSQVTLDALEQEKQSDTSNIQMNYELGVSQQPEIKGVQKRWTFDPATIDMKLLPDEFKTYDEKKIKEAIANGAKEIPGVKIEQKIINQSR